MSKNSQDELVRAYATLSSLRKNTDQIHDITPIYVNEFHSVLAKLEGIGITVSEFRIPDSEIKPRPSSINSLTGEVSYTQERYVAKAYFLTKLDAILGYFEIITSEKPKRIGFHTEKD